ncbi:hypothetical protein PCANC_22539 [Puccinia coronata f. sp. avenae]|uniref:Uncharacterized protein n=1 Tax=Puccinia coronata f. sp. avenae TaxID=200324 RepID=A0A2N5TWJ7_9BASI|nr:hypothetical protein PCANC_22539 [Puccinia coronata f. sp. avenae]
MASLVTFLQGMVKHKRTHLRNLVSSFHYTIIIQHHIQSHQVADSIATQLLTNARQEHRPRELGPVPKLMDLLVLINQAFQPRNALQSLAEIRANMNAGVQVQIAMLCLLTMEHLVHRAPGDTRSQWDLIDNHLEAIRAKSKLELQV